ncbi:PEP-CTERM sorting domain-containing protein [Planctomyces sp. SH-PL62]|uniref:PEP-CTERM sorting domain-containing protein n=1 Tax=Planctomyces sp. SH-PL62 TaxID=1636152 RepID=UPI00078BC089|nr:PEP-CTERM sorting domain-containing protein [Planctomyces sp. SH-PL62]AMV36311.1 hypothetical protein VT85_02635 [Planctomyces sp. SH-PL62]
MNASVRGLITSKHRAWVVVLGFGVLSASAQASPVRFSTSGSFVLPAGTVELAGKTDVTIGDGPLSLGTLPIGENPGGLGAAPFQVKFTFDGLPEIQVSGTIAWLGYNANMPVHDTVVTTSATSNQIGLYPEVFQRLIAHPDWMHTTSYQGYLTDMEVTFAVNPFDPDAPRTVPEPSTALLAVAAFAGLAWKARRRSLRG